VTPDVGTVVGDVVGRGEVPLPGVVVEAREDPGPEGVVDEREASGPAEVVESGKDDPGAADVVVVPAVVFPEPHAVALKSAAKAAADAMASRRDQCARCGRRHQPRSGTARRCLTPAVMG